MHIQCRVFTTPVLAERQVAISKPFVTPQAKPGRRAVLRVHKAAAENARIRAAIYNGDYVSCLGRRKILDGVGRRRYDGRLRKRPRQPAIA